MAMHAEVQTRFETSSCPPAIPPSILPSASSPALTLVSATPTEYDHTWHLNGNEWGGPLSMSQYFIREQFLLEQPLTKDAQITAWLLTSPNLPSNPDGSRPILAACETLLVRAYVARNGTLSQILAHGIASVFTRPEHRGKGYAGRMMAELGKKLDTWQQPNGAKGTFSVLYSDIGKAFYAKQGWKAYPSTHIHLAPITSQDLYTENRSRLKLPELSDLASNDLPSLPTIQNLETELVAKSKRNPNIPHIGIRVDMEHFGWHHAREEIQASMLGLPEPAVKGAIHKPTGTALIWTRVFATKPEEWQLVVLRTIVPDTNTDAEAKEVEHALAALLLRAQREAGTSNMQAGVEVWSPETTTLCAAQRLRGEEEGKVQVVSRDKEHICCLRWAADEEQEVVWVGMEKYAWC